MSRKPQLPPQPVAGMEHMGVYGNIGNQLGQATLKNKEHGTVVKVVGNLAEQFTQQNGIVGQGVKVAFSGAQLATKVVVASSGYPIPTDVIFILLEQCATAVTAVMQLVSQAVKNRCLCLELANRCKITFEDIDKAIKARMTHAEDGPVKRLLQLLQNAATVIQKFQKQWKVESLLKANINADRFEKINAELTRIRSDVMFRLQMKSAADLQTEEAQFNASFEAAKRADLEELNLMQRANQAALNELRNSLVALGGHQDSSLASVDRMNKKLQNYFNEGITFHWEIKREYFQIAQGNFGQPQRLGGPNSKVFAGVNRGSACAIKEYRKGEFIEAKVVKEVELLLSIHHQNICKAIGACRSLREDKFYVLMEKLNGGSLEDKIKRGPLSVQEVTKCATGIAEGLKFLHKMKPSLVHRAITPENILIDDRGNAKLINFGIAKREGEQTMAGGAAVSARWTAPETYNDIPIKAPAMDIFSLGIVIWQMLSGKEKPFADIASETHVARHLISNEPIRFEWPQEAPQFFRDLVKMCTNKDYLSRPSAEEVVEMLEGFEMNDYNGPVHPMYDSAPAIQSSSTNSSARPSLPPRADSAPNIHSQQQPPQQHFGYQQQFPPQAPNPYGGYNPAPAPSPGGFAGYAPPPSSGGYPGYNPAPSNQFYPPANQSAAPAGYGGVYAGPPMGSFNGYGAAYAPSEKWATVIYDYQAANYGEVSIFVGDRVKVVNQGLDGWWEGESRGQFGKFPGNRVQLL